MPALSWNFNTNFFHPSQLAAPRVLGPVQSALITCYGLRSSPSYRKGRRGLKGGAVDENGAEGGKRVGGEAKGGGNVRVASDAAK